MTSVAAASTPASSGRPDAEPDLDLATPWGGTHHWVDLNGDVHWVDFGAPEDTDDAPPILLVHGLGGSHLNWGLLAPELRDVFHVYAVDLAGFGLTRPSSGRQPTVQSNADLVARFIDEVVGKPVLLVGNSMGGMISSMVAARHPELVTGVVLLNPALPPNRLRPDAQLRSVANLVTPTVRARRAQRRGVTTTPEQEVAWAMQVCVPGRVEDLDRDLFMGHVELARRRRSFDGVLKGVQVAATSMIAGTIDHRRVARRLARISAPVLLLHGTRDPLVPVGSARWAARRNPDWTYVEIPGMGHIPMIEFPAKTADLIKRFANARGVA